MPQDPLKSTHQIPPSHLSNATPLSPCPFAALSPRRLSVECGWGIAGFGERHPTPSGSYALLSPPCFRSTQAAPPPLHHAAATVTVSSYDVSSGAVAPAPLPPSTAAEGLSHSVSAPCFSMEPRNWLEYSGRASTDLLGS
ncbi:unnamed protein product [Closterium sp. NIES-54]